MTPAVRQRRAVRLLGLVTVLGFAGLIARFWHPVYGYTAFFQLDASNDEVKLAAFRDRPVYVHRGTGGYDGLYYAQIALDPTLRDPQLPAAMDNFAYRARRILPSALAWLLGAGRPAGIIFAYSVLNLAAWLALAVVLWRILDVADLRGWLAWAAVLFSAGALASVRFALTDLPATAIIAGAIWTAERWHGRLAVALLSLAALARETALLAVAGLCKRPWLSGKNLARVLLAFAPLFAWLGYVRGRAGPADAGWGNFTLPFAALAEKLHAAFAALGTVADHALAGSTLLAMVGLVAQAVFIVHRPRPDDRWWRIGATYTVLLAFLGTAVWEGFPGAATRVLLPLTLAFNVLAHRRRAALAWLIIGNLGVTAGLVELRDVPSDPHEVAAVRADGLACVARTDDGWYGRETLGRHTWFWATQHGAMSLEAWPKIDASVQLTFSLRSLSPRVVIVRAAGRELARFQVGSTMSSHTLTAQLAHGRATLEFSTDAPPAHESAESDARQLGFALYDPRLKK